MKDLLYKEITYDIRGACFWVWKYLKGLKYKVGLLINFGKRNLEIKRIVYDIARTDLGQQFGQRRRSALVSAEKGFTLMEIIVSTTIFSFVTVALLSMFNYTLKINRRSEALRQATQGMRNFAEYLVKEIRNGEIDYGIINGTTYTSAWPASPSPYCGLTLPGAAGAVVSGSANSTYLAKSNKLAIIDSEGEQKCFYFGTAGGTSPASDGTFYDSNGTISEETVSGKRQVLNPPNIRVENVMFIIRPTCDPYTLCSDYSGSYPKIQPSVQIMIKFVTELPTKEKVTINYQTSVSINKYDIPNK